MEREVLVVVHQMKLVWLDEMDGLGSNRESQQELLECQADR